MIGWLPGRTEEKERPTTFLCENVLAEIDNGKKSTFEKVSKESTSKEGLEKDRDEEGGRKESARQKDHREEDGSQEEGGVRKRQKAQSHVPARVRWLMG